MTVDTSETQGKGAVIGGWICLALGAAFMVSSEITFVLYMPLFFAAFVLGIVAIAQNRIWHGIPTLLLSVVLPLVIGFGLANHQTQQGLDLLKKPLNNSMSEAISQYNNYMNNYYMKSKKPFNSSTSETTEVSDNSLQMRYGKIKETNNVGRFIANENGTVLDTETDLMWAAKDNGLEINWQDAKSYCENYRGGGYMDWRMPTQDELAGLYDAGKSRPGACNTSYQLHVATELIDITCFGPWASETRGSEAALFSFNSGRRLWTRQSSGNDALRALPVRSGR